MLSTDRLLRVIVELLFFFLGGLVVWLGATNHIRFDRHSLGWLAVSVILVLWGARGLFKPAKYLSRGENWMRATSLVLLGLVMVAISRVPFEWVPRLLALVGVLLAARGLAGALLVFGAKPRRV
ncbi:MAG: hypothetical protein ABSG69_04600 [Candidatus Acidiferrum sp.]|jgi:hypothetical protein